MQRDNVFENVVYSHTHGGSTQEPDSAHTRTGSYSLRFHGCQVAQTRGFQHLDQRCPSHDRRRQRLWRVADTELFVFYVSAVRDVSRVIDALFEGYPEASEVSRSHFLPEEVIFHGGGSVRRGVLERPVAEAVPRLGGVYEPQHTYRTTNTRIRVPTSPFGLESSATSNLVRLRPRETLAASRRAQSACIIPLGRLKRN